MLKARVFALCALNVCVVLCWRRNNILEGKCKTKKEVKSHTLCLSLFLLSILPSFKNSSSESFFLPLRSAACLFEHIFTKQKLAYFSDRQFQR